MEYCSQAGCHEYGTEGKDLPFDAMMQQRPLLLLLLAAYLTSCAPKRSEILLNTTTTPPDVLLKLVKDRGARLKSLIGSGTLSFESPEIAGTAAFESNLKKPDSLLVTLEGPFGIDVGTLFLSKERYVMYNSFENSVATGDPNSSTIRSFIPFDLTQEQILDVFAGVLPVPDAGKELQRYAIDDNMFSLSYTCGVSTCTYWVDPEYALVTRFEQRDTSGNLLVEARAYSFTRQAEAAAARRVQMKFPQKGRQLFIAYDAMSLNATDTDFRFTVPSNARKISRP
jgi:hypothetical protein